MGELLGQIAGFLIILAIIYYPFIKPLTLLKKGDIVIRKPLNENAIGKLKIFSISITLYHLLLSLFVFIFSIIRTINLSNVLGEEYITGYTFLGIGILGTILGCFVATLAYLVTGKDTKENLLKLGFIIPVHCIIGIASSFMLGGYLFFNENQKIFGLLIFSMIVVEIIYIIRVGIFKKQTGLIWETPKKISENLKDNSENK